MNTLQEFFQTSPVPPNTLAQGLWWIIGLPLLGAFVCGVFGKKLGRANVSLVASAAVGGSLLISLLAFWAVNDVRTAATSAYAALRTPYTLAVDSGTWFAVGDFRVNFGLQVDHLTAILLLVITGVGFLIHVYSAEYMSHDDGYWRYFAYLNLFVAMMLTLVMADSLVLLFVGWEGVGLCSYLLIGFWYSDAAKAWAGRKAFITNRIGDFAFLIAAFLLVTLVAAFESQATRANFGFPGGSPTTFSRGLDAQGPLHFEALKTFSRALVTNPTPGGAVAAVTPDTPIATGPLKDFTYGGVLTAVLLLFLLGASGKSAQLPLYVWLPDAMAGPTPVSALIHAATMVTAGVYLFCRLNFLLVFSPVAMGTVAVVGALTALIAALIAFAQDDIKKVLAYSTVSQLGLMFMAVGMGVFWAAIFHLVTHAFFKACLFLGAGSVMHGNADETDIKRLGGVGREMKWTAATFGVATLAITGVLPLSGFFSKDAILHGIHQTELFGLPWVGPLVLRLGQLVAVCTAFYMTRLFVLTFWGERSPEARAARAHESGATMVGPLVVLAVLSVVALVYGLNLINGQPVMENFLGPVFEPARRVVSALGTVRVEHGPIGVGGYAQAWALALLGAGAACFLYLRFYPTRAGQQAPAAVAAVRRFTQNKFYVDELYELLFIKPLKALSFVLYKVVDALLIDTVAVRGTAWVTTRVGAALRYVQTGNAQAYAAVMALALVGGVAYVIVRFLTP
ncbi:MAG: NADH-quinone oxidoreductase subunit L [Myxococcaceae bacterium]|nr:NADH-quinone oxidoreductase subunit L [Myxococcaceae bacterium]MCI0671131.1 NADH-quinone oxidoreductase subunit L [Myxococcaceae bacterium]